MSKINLTHKPTSEQVRIVRDYLNRRAQHKEQGEVTIDQIVKRFKHNRLMTDRAKFSHFDKLLKMIEQESGSDKGNGNSIY
jgi:hypothetical protein